MDAESIFEIERPSPELLKLYIIRSLLTGPGLFLVFPPLLLRYLTLRYSFDENGISMRWGFLFRREVNLAYSRIQDIHLVSGLIQRWLGLADIMIQTASGNASAEIKIEGLHEFEEIRSFLYSRMRGYKSEKEQREEVVRMEESPSAILRDILNELKGSRTALEKLSEKGGASNV